MLEIQGEEHEKHHCDDRNLSILHYRTESSSDEHVGCNNGEMVP
jgi:hypothetical protein